MMQVHSGYNLPGASSHFKVRSDHARDSVSSPRECSEGSASSTTRLSSGSSTRLMSESRSVSQDDLVEVPINGVVPPGTVRLRDERLLSVVCSFLRYFHSLICFFHFESRTCFPEAAFNLRVARFFWKRQSACAKPYPLRTNCPRQPTTTTFALFPRPPSRTADVTPRPALALHFSSLHHSSHLLRDKSSHTTSSTIRL